MNATQRIARMIAEKKAQLNSETIFSSPYYRDYLQNIADTISGKYGRGAIVETTYDTSENASVAYTDGCGIHINMGNDLTQGIDTTELKNISGIGLLGHEVGHILFTDFSILEKYMESLKKGKFYPKTPTAKQCKKLIYRQNLQDIEDVLAKANPKILAFLFKIAKDLSNIVEDGYVERMMKQKFPGTVALGIQITDQKQAETSPSVKTMIDEGYEPYCIVANCLLLYAKTGQYNNPDNLANEYVDVIADCEELVKEAVMEDDPKKRMSIVNLLIVYCWGFIQDRIDEIENQLSQKSNGDSSDSQSGTGGNSPENSDGDLSDSQSGTGSNSSDNSEGDSSGSQSGTGSNSSENSDGDSSDSQSGTGGNSSENSDGDSSNQSGTGNSSTGNCPFPQSVEELLKKMEGETQSSSSVPQNIHTNSVLKQSNGSYQDFPVSNNTSSDTEKAMKSASEILEKAKKEMARKAVETENEEALQKQLQDEAQRLRKQQNLKIRVDVRREEVTQKGKLTYPSAIAPLKPISKMLQKSILTVIKQRQRGFTERGLMMGTRLDSSSYYKADGKIFTKRCRPNDELNLAVAVLIDMSGSMSDNSKIESARNMSLLIYDFCKSLHIPIMIYGHNADYIKNNVRLYSFADFDSIDGNDGFRIMNMEADDCNRDGTAIRFCADKLNKRTEEKKLFILVSDGLPSAYDREEDGIADVKGAKKECDRRGITFIAAAIDSDKEQIKAIYGEKSFLDISDLSKLPVTMAKLLARYILT